ncbi:hypothetical protein H1Q78_07145 [Cellulosimicrobium cellulans]|uniref:hypothetical protein n=1 Tax=Cellulosimicrobium cellulans TaxID=1710 RepID=UPI001EDABB28|nr:hypothetical protein [Cellulosimicrobium cellulans]UKJ62224.1 hypothetical protein H1Q78_07145 [Cellulosimicrobium cellulans]
MPDLSRRPVLGEVVEDDVRRDAVNQLSLAPQGEAGQVVDDRAGSGDEITDPRPLPEAPFCEGSSWRCPETVDPRAALGGVDVLEDVDHDDLSHLVALGDRLLEQRAEVLARSCCGVDGPTAVLVVKV